MTKPLRRYLLNEQIHREARRIAHAATRSCVDADGQTEHGFVGTTADAVWHTPKCNELTLEIIALAMQVKLGTLQRKKTPAEMTPEVST